MNHRAARLIGRRLATRHAARVAQRLPPSTNRRPCGGRLHLYRQQWWTHECWCPPSRQRRGCLTPCRLSSTRTSCRPPTRPSRSAPRAPSTEGTRPRPGYPATTAVWRPSWRTAWRQAWRLACRPPWRRLWRRRRRCRGWRDRHWRATTWCWRGSSRGWGDWWPARPAGTSTVTRTASVSQLETSNRHNTAASVLYTMCIRV